MQFQGQSATYDLASVIRRVVVLTKRKRGLLLRVICTTILTSVLFLLGALQSNASDSLTEKEKICEKPESKVPLTQSNSAEHLKQVHEARIKADLAYLEEVRKQASLKTTSAQPASTATPKQPKPAPKIQPKEAKASPKKTSRSSARVLDVLATAYISRCSGCSGITATGLDVRNHTPKIIAVDPRLIPLKSKVELIVDGESWGIYSAEDTGGHIKGRRIDVLMSSKSKALDFGKRRVKVRVLK